MYDRPMTTPLLHFCFRTQPYTPCAGGGKYSIPAELQRYPLPLGMVWNCTSLDVRLRSLTQSKQQM